MNLQHIFASVKASSVILSTVLLFMITVVSTTQPTEARQVAEDVRIESLAKWITKQNPTSPATRIARNIIENADKLNIDPYVIASHIQIESMFNPSATGEAGERGLMQMSKGASDRCDLDWQMAYDIEENIRGGSCYIAIHMNTYKGNVRKAVYRYNGGGDPKYNVKFDKVYFSMVQYISPDRIVIVKSGDTLATLSIKYFGTHDSWRIIADVNSIENPDLINVGQSLTIPGKHHRESVASK